MKGPRTILQVQRIQGTSFIVKEEAEQHGIELCKLWIDEHVQGWERSVSFSITSTNSCESVGLMRYAAMPASNAFDAISRRYDPKARREVSQRFEDFV